MKKVLFLLTLLGLTVSVFAQTRKDIKIYLPTVLASPTQAQFFKENFEMETTAAGYSLTNNPSDADYTLRLTVKPNMILFDDGEEEPAGPDEKQFVLQINLTRNKDDVELVAFAFPFTNVAEMYEFNLFLLYEAMANVPLTKLHEDLENTRWRNKWLYVRASFDYPITFYQLDQQHLPSLALWNDDDPPQLYHMDNKTSPYPGATIGLELHYLDWLSTELGFNLNFSGPTKATFIPAIQIEQKFPIKLAKHFMIEPYGAVSFPMTTSDIAREFPKFGVGGGVQLGMKGGDMGALFVDVNFLYFLGDVTIDNPEARNYPNPSTVKYTRFVVGLGIGYKVGFFDRSGKLK